MKGSPRLPLHVKLVRGHLHITVPYATRRFNTHRLLRWFRRLPLVSAGGREEWYHVTGILGLLLGRRVCYRGWIIRQSKTVNCPLNFQNAHLLRVNCAFSPNFALSRTRLRLFQQPVKCKLNLPTYSPEHNPVELLWKWIKPKVYGLSALGGIAGLVSRLRKSVWHYNRGNMYHPIKLILKLIKNYYSYLCLYV